MILDTLLLRVVPVLLFWPPFYYIMGLRTDGGRPGIFLGILLLANVAAAALTTMFGILLPSLGTANLVCSVAMLFSLLFGGILMNPQVSDGLAGFLFRASLGTRSARSWRGGCWCSHRNGLGQLDRGSTNLTYVGSKLFS